MPTMEEYFTLLKDKGVTIVSYADLQYDIILGAEKKKEIARFVRSLAGKSGKFESYRIMSGEECLLSIGINPNSKLTKSEKQLLLEINEGDELMALCKDEHLNNEEDCAILFTYDTTPIQYLEYITCPNELTSPSSDATHDCRNNQ